MLPVRCAHRKPQRDHTPTNAERPASFATCTPNSKKIGKEPIRRSPNPVAKHAGSRIRMRRMMLGMSQEKLADGLGVTFQQVQKYEKGRNRIGAGRLQH